MIKDTSFKSVLKNIQRKLEFGNKNRGLTRDRLDEIWNKKYVNVWFKCINIKRKPYVRVKDLSYMCVLALQTRTDMEIDFDYDGEDNVQLYVLNRAIKHIKDLGYDAKFCIYETLKEVASKSVGYFNEKGKFIRYKFAKSVDDIREKFSALNNKTFEEVENGWKCVETGEYINKVYIPKFKKLKVI